MRSLASIGSRSLCFALVLCAFGCLEQPRNGQIYMQRLTDPITFSGYLRTPNITVDIMALNPGTGRFDRITSAVTLPDPADCDVAGQCWYRFSASRVIPNVYYKNVGTRLFRALIQTQPFNGPPIDPAIFALDFGQASNDCFARVYPQFGGLETVLQCSPGNTAVEIFVQTP